MEERCDKEISLIANMLIIAEKKELLKEVQELLKPIVINNTSIDLDTISVIEVLLDFKLLNFDEETTKDKRLKKLEKLKIVTGEVNPVEIYITFNSETGIVELKK
jgi:hypothetical protein